MTTSTPTRPTTDLVTRRLLQVGIGVLILAASLFISSGRLDWIMGWVFLGVYVGGVAVNALGMSRELIAERAEMKADTKRWDRIIGPLSLLFWTPVSLIVAGLDVRFGWSSGITLLVYIIGLAALVFGYGLTLWAMMSNRFFATTVRIQKERGHTVVSSGPYQLVRHPGYLGFSIAALATPLLLGSWWAFVPAVLAVCMITIRTALEDRTLREELEGYESYSRRVRYRLLPGVW